MRGPGVGRGRVVQSLIGNVDLAPTFLEIAGVPVPPHMDGASIFRFFQKEKVKSRAPWRDTYLIERGKMPPAHFPKLNVVEDVPNNNEGTLRVCKNNIHPSPPSPRLDSGDYLLNVVDNNLMIGVVDVKRS